jgi:hypothetical protein
MRVVLLDVDSKIPNLALMKLSSFYKLRRCEVVLSRSCQSIPADLYFASAVFNLYKSSAKIQQLTKIYGDRISFGGTGIDLTTSLSEEIDECFPDYRLYDHTTYALGFLTRGCNKRCAFCVVPKKEGRLRPNYSTFDDFVPKGQQNVMLLDNNLLAAPNVHNLLDEMARRKLRVNFSQTLDIQLLTDEIYQQLKKVDSVNSRFSRKMIYFSCNSVKQAEWFCRQSDKLRGFGKDQVTAVIMYGFNTRLSQDYTIINIMRKLGVLPFVQQYQPIFDKPPRVPDDYFDMDLDEVAQLRFRTNGQNGEKFLRYVNQLYFNTYGKYYLPLLKAIYRYNNKQRLQYYLERPNLLSVEMYKRYA